MRTKVKTACNRDCPDGCGVIATVEDGQVVRLQGDPEHPVTKGFLCKRTSRFLERQYDPTRITQAMIRRNKGQANARWETVPVDRALDLVADRLLQYRDEFGPASIMNYRCGGSMGMMKYVTDYFFQLVGPVTIKSGDICAGAAEWAQETDFGIQDSNDFFDLLNARKIFLWGKNVFVSHVHLLPVLKQAKANGARLVLIDPIKHRTSSLCDQYVSIEPAGDAALALGMARWLMENGRFDSEVESYCENLPEYRDLINSRTIDQWSSMAGVETSTLCELAECYSDGPSTILVGWGMQRRRNGAAIIRAIDALGAVSGNIGIPGAGVSFYFPRRGAFDLSFLKKESAPRAIPEPLLGPGIESASNPPIKLVFVSAANPVTNVPESETVRRALQDRFTVVVDMFTTDTAACADVILPAATMLEDDDLIGAYGHHYLNKLEPVVPPPNDALTDYEIIRRLALRVGLADHFDRDARAWQRDMIRPLEENGIHLKNIGARITRNPKAANVVFADRKFPTASGRVNLMTNYEHPATPVCAKYPFRLMAISTDDAQASQWAGRDQTGPASLKIHPTAANGFTVGDIAVLESQSGSMEVQIVFDGNQRLDIVAIDKGGWLSAGRCANAIIPAECSDHGQCAVYYDTPVRLVKKKGRSEIMNDSPSGNPAMSD